MSKMKIGFAGSVLKSCISILPNFLTKPMIANSSEETKKAIMTESVKRGNKGIFDFLIQKNVRLDIINDKKETLLHLATKYGRVEIAESLLLRDEGMKDAQDIKGETPIFHAVRQANRKIFDMFLEKSADIQVANKEGKSSLDCIFEAFGKYKKNPQVWRKLFNKLGDNYVKREDYISKALIEKWSEQENIKDINSPSFNRALDYILFNCAPKKIEKFLELILTQDPEYIKKREDNGKNFVMEAIKLYEDQESVADKIRVLAAKGVRLNLKHPNQYEGEAPLHAAFQREKCFYLLLELGIDINDADSKGRTVLHYASPYLSNWGKYKTCLWMEELLSLGADINAKDSEGRSLRSYVDLSGRLEKDYSIADTSGGGLSADEYESAVEHGIYRWVPEDKGKYYDVLNFWGADDKENKNNIINEEGQTVMHLEVIKGKFEQLEKFLDRQTKRLEDEMKLRAHNYPQKIIKKINLNIRDKSGKTPLCYAIIGNNLRIVEKLYNYQVAANSSKNLNGIINIPSQRDKEGNSLLHYAMTPAGSAEIVKFLLEKKTNVNAVDGKGQSPIFAAVRNNRLDLVKLLLENKASINLADKNGNTPLHEAVREGKTEIVEFIINHGGDPQLKNKEGKSAFDLIDQREYPEMKEILMEKNRIKVTEGAVPSVSPVFAVLEERRKLLKKSPAPDNLEVLKEKNMKLLETLLNQGADIDQQNRQGNTLMHLAITARDKDIVEILERKKPDLNIKNNKGETCIDLLKKKEGRNIVSSKKEKKPGLRSKNLGPDVTPEVKEKDKKEKDKNKSQKSNKEAVIR